MDKPLAQLRRELDFFPSPDRSRPGLVIQDRHRFSPHQMIVPPALVQPLALFDGNSTVADLRAALVRLTGDLQVGELAEHLHSSLSTAGFLEDENFERMREERLREWRSQEAIAWSHSGPGNYPDEPAALRSGFDNWFLEAPPASHAPGLRAIASPHASPGAAKRSYTAAYAALAKEISKEQAAGKTFVILGTSHYGEIDRLGTTARDFTTPLGRAPVHRELLDELRASGGAGITEEDYFFSMEHSVEFQVVFLQYLYGPGVRILPLLCGSYARSIYLGGAPEANDDVRRYMDALRQLNEKHGDKLVWVLGVDMAHMGKRYDDEEPVSAGAGRMEDVERRDRKRIDALNASDAGAFWDQVQENRDDLKWCGSAPFYTFLRAVPGLRGDLLSYEQWQIDPQSVVTLGALSFAGRNGSSGQQT